MSKLHELRSTVAGLRDEIAALSAIEDITPDDDARLSAALDEFEARKAELDGEEARQARIDAARSTVTDRASGVDTLTIIRRPDRPAVEDVRSMDIRQVTDAVTRSAEERDIDPTFARSLLKRHGRDLAWARNLAARSTDVYTSAFEKLMTGRDAFMTDEERAAAAVGTNTAGGFLVPTHLDPSVMLTSTGSENILRRIGRVVTLTDGNVWNGITSAGVAASFDAELAEVSDDTPSFAKSSVTVHKAQAFVQASIEAFADIDGLAGEVLMMFADARTVLESAKFCTGTGTAEPWGVFAALDANTNREFTSTTAAVIGLVDLQDLRQSVGPRWRGRSSWLMHPDWADEIKRLGTALSASYSTDITQANADRLLGRPVYESDDAPNTATTTVRDNRIVFGDFSNYVIVDKPGATSVEFIPHLFNTSNNLPDGRRGWLAHWRVGADSVNDSALSLLQDKTSA